jgi:aryl-alcohol dehydrogenase-like predicted oxidoreductase
MGLPHGTFGHRGAPITRLGLGGEGILRTYGREREAQAVIEAALDAGITYLESARAYLGSESYYGSVLGSRRADVFLATKAHERTRAGARAMLETSLRALRTDVLDLWQLHDVRDRAELDEFEDPGGAYAAFVEAKERGDVRAIGVTGHHDPAVLREALERFRFDSVLLPINPAEGALADAFEREVVPAARARDMAVIGMKVFARGMLLDRSGVALSVASALGYALAADVDALVIGCDDAAQVAENARLATLTPPMVDAERCELEATLRPFARRLAYYRGPTVTA